MKFIWWKFPYNELKKIVQSLIEIVDSKMKWTFQFFKKLETTFSIQKSIKNDVMQKSKTSRWIIWTINQMMKDGSVFLYSCDDSTKCETVKVLLYRGYWKLECWGASGGNATKGSSGTVFEGGKGGYSVGVVRVTSDNEVFYLNIGGEGLSFQTGKSQEIKGGNNGGGKGWVGTLNYSGASGGGGTDIRRNGNDISDRIIVAGGGGGAGAENSNSDEDQYGGFGGGLIGGNGGGRGDNDIDVATGGSQKNGGIKGTASDAQWGEDGSEFNGGSATITQNTASSGGGGGGGYFGGGGATSTGGGGGSGYIGGVISYGSIKKETVAGNTSFPNPYGGFEVGHWGNGVIKITNLNNKCSLLRSNIFNFYSII